MESKEVRSDSLVLDEKGRLVWIDPNDSDREPLVITNPPAPKPEPPKSVKESDHGVTASPQVHAVDRASFMPVEMDVTDIPDEDIETIAKLNEAQIQAIINEHMVKHSLIVRQFITRIRAEWLRRHSGDSQQKDSNVG